MGGRVGKQGGRAGGREGGREILFGNKEKALN